MPKNGDDKKKPGSRGRKPSKTGRAPSRSGSPSAQKKRTAAAKRPPAGTNPLYALGLLGLGALVVIMATKLYFGGPKKTNNGAGKTGMTLETASTEEVPRVVPDAEKGKTEIKKDAQVSKLVPERNVVIYLVHLNEKTEKMSLLTVKRKINTDTPVQGAMEALIRGPSAAEKRKGLLTAIPPDLRIIGMSVKDGIAVINFSEAVEKNASGTIILSRIDQIVYTATQFPEIRGVIIQINGTTRKFIGSDGLSLSAPLTRQWH